MPLELTGQSVDDLLRWYYGVFYIHNHAQHAARLFTTRRLQDANDKNKISIFILLPHLSNLNCPSLQPWVLDGICATRPWSRVFTKRKKPSTSFLFLMLTRGPIM